MIIVKKHLTQDKGLILAICDKELLGRKFEQGELQLDLTSNFYAGEELTKEDTISLMKKAYSINAVGGKSVALCLGNKVIEEKNINKIENIPYAYMVRM